jgi:hypothetical protein
MAAITEKSFGRHSDRVQDFGGEYILPISETIEIHPGPKGGWFVVAVQTGAVLATFTDIDEAVDFAEAR